MAAPQSSELHLDDFPPWSREHNLARFPHAIADYFVTGGLTVRERRMLDFINEITDKPEWDRKVFDDDIVSEWRTDACRYDQSLKDEYLSQAMFNYCVSELQDKASIYQRKGFVAVMDADATVVKSDSAVPDDLRQSLIRAVDRLENFPGRQKDWRPGSNNQVLDLVHPSLFPLIFGRSRVLPSRRVPLTHCARFTGRGETVPRLGKYILVKEDSWGYTLRLEPWGIYQWLPAQVDFTPADQPRITSYINNLHPQNADLYAVLEKLVDKSIPLWNECLSWFHDRRRIEVGHTSDDDWYIPESVKWTRPTVQDNSEEESRVDELDDRKWASRKGFGDQYKEWWEKNRRLKQKEPIPFVPFSQTIQRPLVRGANPVDLRSTYKTSGLQVIFKLVNICLTPEKPEYNGSKWHVEGVLNDHICATAIYCYDSHNIEPSHLAFRQSVNTWDLIQKTQKGQYSSACAFYGIDNEGPAVQKLGQVGTPQGRLLAFPNVMQNRASSIRLADPTQPGHCKILTMFLVDPHQRLLSTANVPPQRRDWWAYELGKMKRFKELPEEMFQAIIGFVDDFSIGRDEALVLREDLMAERSTIQHDAEDAMHGEWFILLKH